MFVCQLIIPTVMPAKISLFDQRAKSLHEFGTAFCNTILFNPQARLVALAGFGNLAGNVDIYDRRTLNKVTSIDAANTSFCEWSPDGRFLLTATLSPRLRVDNGIKIWHCSGPLVHVQSVDELYQASWRPTHSDALPPFPPQIPISPPPASSVADLVVTPKPTPVKAAYRPPGARGLEASSVYKRDDGTPSGNSTPNGRYSRSPAPGRSRANGNGRRHVPGAPTSPSPVRSPDPEKRGRKQKKKGEKTGDGANGTKGLDQGRPSLEVQINGDGKSSAGPLSPTNGSAPATPAADVGGLDPTAKKIRNLTKKVAFPLSVL